MRKAWFLLCILSFSFLNTHVWGRKASCKDPYYGRCYGIPHACPAGCPRLCEVDCTICKPYCACDRPGSVCQDPRFIGGDGVMFYFHGEMEKDFCLVSDSYVHVNGHFIGKKRTKGRDFTWVQSIGVLFGPHQLYLGARKVAKWHQSTENMIMQLDGKDVAIPAGESETWKSPGAGLMIRRREEANVITAEVAGLFQVAARVVPITTEESRVHGYDVAEDDCFAHLELSFKFDSLSQGVNGVLGQTYSSSYRSRVKMAAAMPIMGGVNRFASSHLFATDCAVSRFGSKMEDAEGGEPLNVACLGGNSRGQGIVCRR